MNDIVSGVIGFLVGHAGAAVATMLAGALAGHVLPKVISTARRAHWMNQGLSTVYTSFIKDVVATPNKYDDAGMAFVASLRDWAAKQEMKLTDEEHAKAQTFFAQKLAMDVALAPLRVSAKK